MLKETGFFCIVNGDLIWRRKRHGKYEVPRKGADKAEQEPLNGFIKGSYPIFKLSLYFAERNLT